MTEEQENAESGDNRQLVVGNLPTNCEKEFLEDFFESRRKFGDGIEVENIDFENDEAKITFKKATDVDQILQRHVRDPCVFGRKELTLKPLKPYCDSVDGGSFVESGRSRTHTAGDSHFSSLQKYDSLLSLSSTTSVTSFDSNEMFGSGGSRYHNFSKEFEELHLVCQQPEQEKRIIKLSETDISPVVVSYAATTCSADKIRNDGGKLKHKSIEGTSDMTQTLFQETLSKQFDGEVDVKTETLNIVVTLTGNVKTDNSMEDFQETMMATLKSLEGIVTVQLHELSAERSEFAFKHFQSLLHHNQTIKMYRTDDEFSFYIAFQTESDKHLVDIHVAIVRDQNVIRQEKPLSMTDYYRIEAFRSRFDNQSARITIDENRIVIEGFEEDVNTTTCAVNKVLHTSNCIKKGLDEFAVDRLKDEDIVAEIRHKLTNANLKIWWKCSGQFLYVVGKGKNEKQSTKAAELIAGFFSTDEVELPDYLLDSPLWKITKSCAVVNNPRRLFVDDKTKRPLVVIKGTTQVCKTFAETTKDFKKDCTRATYTKRLSEAKCDFVLRHLRHDFENMNEREYLKLQQGSDKTELIMEGTKVAQQKIESEMKEISTQTFWICDEKVVDRLRTLAEDKECRLTGTVQVFEKQTQLLFKSGRIENEQVDVIVNSASQDLNLGTGDHTITNSISNAAGEQAQKYLERFQRPVKAGNVIVGDAGNMKCKAIFHAVLENFRPNDSRSSIENLRKVVSSCLNEASKRGYGSIAFPALCTGVHGYPVETVAETMIDSITAYCCQNELSSLKEITIIFLDEDPKKRKAFEDCKTQRKQSLDNMHRKKILWNTVPWPCRFFCQITAATHGIATELAQNVNAELEEQTSVKRFEQTE